MGNNLEKPQILLKKTLLKDTSSDKEVLSKERNFRDY